MQKPLFDSPYEVDLTTIRIIAVDDDGDSLDITSIVLADFGATVRAAGSAKDALACLESFRPDVLLLDISLPEVNGFELLKQIRALPLNGEKQIPAIALTAHVQQRYQQQAYESGFQAYLIKPADIFTLTDTVFHVARSQVHKNSSKQEIDET